MTAPQPDAVMATMTALAIAEGTTHLGSAVHLLNSCGVLSSSGRAAHILEGCAIETGVPFYRALVTSQPKQAQCRAVAFPAMRGGAFADPNGRAPAQFTVVPPGVRDPGAGHRTVRAVWPFHPNGEVEDAAIS